MDIFYFISIVFTYFIILTIAVDEVACFCSISLFCFITVIHPIIVVAINITIDAAST